METVTISGTLYSDAEKCRDKNGHEYIRFVVTCGSVDSHGDPKFTHYRCICYQKGFEHLRKGDQVFLSGAQSISLRIDDNGKPWLNVDVYVHTITGGYTKEERIKRSK